MAKFSINNSFADVFDAGSVVLFALTEESLQGRGSIFSKLCLRIRSSIQRLSRWRRASCCPLEVVADSPTLYSVTFLYPPRWPLVIDAIRRLTQDAIFLPFIFVEYLAREESKKAISTFRVIPDLEMSRETKS